MTAEEKKNAPAHLRSVVIAAREGVDEKAPAETPAVAE